MAARTGMTALIARVRVLINDPSGASQTFDDNTIQDVFDESRVDYKNLVLTPAPTFSTGTISYLDYWSDVGGFWEDGYVLKQYLTNTVTPALSEPIVGHFQFSTSTLPPIYLSGSLHDCYRTAADLLERMTAQWLLAVDMTVDGQNVRRAQVIDNMTKLVNQYRMKQRPTAIKAVRTDLNNEKAGYAGILGPQPIDYMARG